MSDANPAIERYMTRFEAALQRFDLPEWREIGADLRSHIAEALDFGKPLDEVLQALGPADVLARAYAVELQLNPRENRGRIAQIVGVLGILAASGIATFIVVTALGSIAVAFVGSGMTLIAIGGLEAAGVHLPNVQLAGLHPLAVVAMGPVFLAIGFGAGWALWAYARALTRMLRNTLPKSWSSRRAA